MNEFTEIIANAQPHPQFDWLLPTALVARGYGCTEGAIRNQKSRHTDELLENLHWVKLPAVNGLYKIFWTKRGVIRLGFFLESARAKAFRNFAESIVLGAVEKSSSRREADLPGQIVVSPKAQINQFQNQQRALSQNDAMKAGQGLQPLAPAKIVKCDAERSCDRNNFSSSYMEAESEGEYEWKEDYLPNYNQQQPAQQVMLFVNNSNVNENGDRRDIPTSIILLLWLTVMSTLVICGCFLIVAWVPALMPNQQNQEVSR